MPKWVAIVNLTPDSFSDGGKFQKHDDLASHIEQLVQDGVQVIDVGAESTRPGASILTDDEEWQRLAPHLDWIIRTAHAHHCEVSLDSYHPRTIEKALALGIDWVNDVSGLQNEQMRELLVASDAKLVLMHSLSIPADPGCVIEADNVVSYIYQWMQTKIQQCQSYGIDPSRLIMDPGIGFNQTFEQSLALIAGIETLQSLGVPLLVGHSRERFLGHYAGDAMEQRIGATLAVSEYLWQKGVDYIRVHDVLMHQAYLRMQTVVKECDNDLNA